MAISKNLMDITSLPSI